jgi:hypothetical protein
MVNEATGVEQELRVRVWFGAHLLRDYRAEASTAQSYAESIGQRFAGLTVTIDARRRGHGGAALRAALDADAVDGRATVGRTFE